MLFQLFLFSRLPQRRLDWLALVVIWGYLRGMAQITKVERENRKRAQKLCESGMPVVRAEAKKLYVAGVSNGRIASELGVGVGTIRCWASRHKWQVHKAQVQSAVVSKLSGKIENTEDIVNVAVSEHSNRIGNAMKGQIDRLANLQLKSEHSIAEVAAAYKTFDDIARRNLGMSTEQPAMIAFGFHQAPAQPTKKAKVVEV